VTAAINLGAFPQALGQNIQRIDPKTGLATQPTLDSEFFLAEWVKDNTQALDNFAVDVQTAADNAQTTADEGLGLANQATAFGRMRLNAVTAPAGTTARFSVELEASPGSGIWYQTGFYMDVTSGGTSRISFVASQFLFIDPSFNGGLAAVVLQYLSGAWYYNVPVILRTGELDANAASKLRSTTGSGSSLSLIVTDFLPASELNVLAIGSVTTGYIDSTVTAIPTAPYVQILLDGGLQAQAFAPVSLDTRPDNPGGSYGTVNLTTGAIATLNTKVWWQAPTGVCPAKFNTSSTSHTITVRWNTASGSMPSADWYLFVAEHKR
jgi:hypothetical protein